MAEASRKFNLTPSQIEEWMGDGLRALENGLKTRPKDLEALHEAKLKDLHAKIGEMTLELEARKKLQALCDQEGSS